MRPFKYFFKIKFIHAFSLGGFIFWSCILYGLYWWAAKAESEHFTETVKLKAESMANHAQALRSWIGKQGGVYIEVEGDIKPHPLLAQLPERDVKTPSGRKLTLLNSPFVLSQISPYFKSGKGDKIHLVSNTPMNPSNYPDPWEKNALKRLEAGVLKVDKVTYDSENSYYRLIYPMNIKPKCLNCHHNYSKTSNKVIGGLSVAVDKTPYDQLTQNVLHEIRMGYFSIWIVGLLGLALFDFVSVRFLRRIEAMATHDGLTDLYNRREIERYIDIECKRANRYTTQLSVILLDIDHFKKVNDQYGHPAGDQALRIVSKVIRQNIRKTDIAGRYGGEEFLILAPGISLEGTKTLTERLRTMIKTTPIQINSQKTITVTASMGFSCHSSAKTSPESLVKSADEALYQAKTDGRDRIGIAE